MEDEQDETDNEDEVNESSGNVECEKPSNQRIMRTAAINPSMS